MSTHYVWDWGRFSRHKTANGYSCVREREHHRIETHWPCGLACHSKLQCWGSGDGQNIVPRAKDAAEGSMAPTAEGLDAGGDRGDAEGEGDGDN